MSHCMHKLVQLSKKHRFSSQVCGQGGPQTPLNLDNCQATIISTLNYTPGLARLARRISKRF